MSNLEGRGRSRQGHWMFSRGEILNIRKKRVNQGRGDRNCGGNPDTLSIHRSAWAIFREITDSLLILSDGLRCGCIRYAPNAALTLAADERITCKGLSLPPP